MSKNHLQEPQRNRNATANFVKLIRTSTVFSELLMTYGMSRPWIEPETFNTTGRSIALMLGGRYCET